MDVRPLVVRGRYFKETKNRIFKITNILNVVPDVVQGPPGLPGLKGDPGSKGEKVSPAFICFPTSRRNIPAFVNKKIQIRFKIVVFFCFI